MAFHVTPLSAGEPLGTYTLAQPIHVLRTRREEAFSAMGSVAHVGFDEPFEMLGYSLTAGEGSIWVDLFWHSTAKHQKTHFLWVHLLDPETGQSVVSEEGLIMKYDWKEGDLFQERRILWLDDVAPGQYALGVALDATPIVDEQAASLLPGGVVMLDVAVRVSPAGLKDSPASEEGGIVGDTPAALTTPWAMVHKVSGLAAYQVFHRCFGARRPGVRGC
jgi:hypothetical protein